MIPGYQELFKRNYGILTEAQQERIRKTKVLILGVSGSGETIATILARSGIEHFILAGHGRYEAADMNRQIGCFIDTVGENKIDHIRRDILAINPEAQVAVHPGLPAEYEIDQLMEKADIIVPAVEDLSYSILCFRSARRVGRPAVLCMPSGTMGWVSVFDPAGSMIEDCFGIPKLGYEGLREVTATPEYKCAQYNFITAGDWRVEWYRDYFLGKSPLALICAAEWLAASLAALETIKIASGKWKPLLAPRCWYIKHARVRKSRFSRFVSYHRKLGWMIFGNSIGREIHRGPRLLWKNIFRYLGYRQRRKEERNR
ncbi:MAG: ThiF family adenylyltransferase [Smithellaceae bacterium]|nr:ThiF family adenylyltransferase [Smithellaceae bacterium]